MQVSVSAVVRLPAAARSGTTYGSDALQVSHHLDYSATVYSTLDNYSGRVSDYFPFRPSKLQSFRLKFKPS